MPTLYATFDDALDAERAAGALFDHGIARRDLTITSKRVSTIRADDTEAALVGDNEGWPPAGSRAIADRKRAVKIDQDQADIDYRAADHAEQTAKRGISITTARDVGIGAIKGSVVGLIGATIITILWEMPPPGAGITSGLLLAVQVLAVGMIAGAIGGGVFGLLTDQGSVRPRSRRHRNGMQAITRRFKVSRPVTLAVTVSPSDSVIAEARRLVCKYHASSIDMS